MLGELIPIVQRSIDALQQNPNPLLQHLQHLIDQEIERQEGLLQQVEEMKKNSQLLESTGTRSRANEQNRVYCREILRKRKRSGNFAWRVTMPNGETD